MIEDGDTFNGTLEPMISVEELILTNWNSEGYAAKQLSSISQM
jgi:hypothetical protein